MAPVVIHDALAHRVIRRLLVGSIECGDDAQAAGVGVFLELRVQHLAHHFDGVFGVHAVVVTLGLDLDVFVHRLIVLFLCDELEVEHTFQDILLAYVRALRIDHRIVGRWRFRQSGQHRCLGQGDVFQVLAEIGTCRGGKTEGTLAQVDLIHVDLKDLILAQRRLDLVGQQNFIDLA